MEQRKGEFDAVPIVRCQGIGPATNAPCDLLEGHKGECIGDPATWREWNEWSS